MENTKRGFAALSKEQRTEIARKGGKAVSENKAHMAEIGSKGGQTAWKNFKARQQAELDKQANGTQQ